MTRKATRRRHGPAIDDDGATKVEIQAVTREEFGRRLRALMEKRHWNQSELARQAELHFPGKFGRDSVSNYINGKNFPGTIHLNALAAALGVDPRELLPGRVSARRSWDERGPAFDLKQVRGGVVRLRLDMEVPIAMALEISRLIHGERLE